MMVLARISALVAVLAVLLKLVTSENCNPSIASSACKPIRGLSTSSYSIDFTQQSMTSPDWVLAEHATVGYGAPNGAEFKFAKRFDAPYIWTNFYILFGRIEVVLRAAPGTGIITGAVMMSDNHDEIDWEWSGNNFNKPTGQVQTNFFGKGIAGTYGRGTSPAVDSPQEKFHTYTFNWTPDVLTWEINGKAVRTLKNNKLNTGEWQYPQTPSRLHLGVWCAGDPDTAPGTVGWGGGYTDFTKLPYSAYVKSVKITTPNPCSSWEFPSPFNGTYNDVRCSNQTIILPCAYSVAPGDDGYKIAKNLSISFDALKGANPGIDWDRLNIGQSLNIPGGTCTGSSTSTSSTTSSVTISSVVTSVSSDIPSLTTTYDGSKTLSSSSRIQNETSSDIMSTSKNPATLSTNSTPIQTTSPAIPSSTLVNSSSKYSSTSNQDLMTTSSTYSRSEILQSTTPVTTQAFVTQFANPGVSFTEDPTTSTSTSIFLTNTSYTVSEGDHGYSVAFKLGCTWEALVEANPGVNWDKLEVGQSLKIPFKSNLSTSGSILAKNATGSSTPASKTTNTLAYATPAPIIYTVAKGDRGRTIAEELGCTFKSLQEVNPGLNWDKLEIGQKLKVPPRHSSSSSLMISVGLTSLTATKSSATTDTLFPGHSYTTLSVGSPSPTTASLSMINSGTTTVIPSESSPSSVSYGATSIPTSQTLLTLPSTSSIITLHSTSSSRIQTNTTDDSSSQSPLPTSYTVRKGDFGWGIAIKNRCSWEELAKANPGVRWDRLEEGQELKIPHFKSGNPSTGPIQSSSSLSVPSIGTSADSSSYSDGTSSHQTDVPIFTSVNTTSATSSSTTTGIPAVLTSSSLDTPDSNQSFSGSTWSAQNESSQHPVSSTTATTSGSSSSSSSSSTPVFSSTSSGNYTSSIPLTATSTTAIGTAPLTPVPTRLICNEDNCLRNIKDFRYITSMQSFCKGYAMMPSGNLPIPTNLNGCGGDGKRISSACSCLLSSSKLPSSESATSTPAQASRSAASSNFVRQRYWRLRRYVLNWPGL